MNKTILSILAGGLVILAAFPAERNEPGSFYVSFRPGTAARAKSPASSSGSSRRVETASLLTHDTRSARPYQARPYAFSMRIGNRLADTYRIDFEGVSSGVENEEIRKWLLSQPGVVSVEAIPAVSIASEDARMPSDPLYRLDDIDAAWHLRQIGFDKVYGKYRASSDVRVAVIDNAVWGEHPDLKIAPENQYFCYTDETGRSCPPSDIDQNKMVGNIANSEAAAWSHGTHCAGLVGAISDNGEGISSFASGVTLMGVRCSDLKPNSMNRGYEGILWAIDNGADILSLSWGSYSTNSVQSDIIKGAIEKGVIIIAAAGNDGIDQELYPGCFDGVICVGSVDSDGSRSSFSNYGDWVTVSAPGGYLKESGKVTPTSQMLLSTTYSLNVQYAIDGRHSIDGLYYDGKAGTSMAAPLTASVVALMKSVNPDLDPESARRILVETSVDGVIDAAAAVGSAAAESGVDSVITDGECESPDAVYSIQGTLIKRNADVSGLEKGIYVISNGGRMKKIVI